VRKIFQILFLLLVPLLFAQAHAATLDIIDAHGASKQMNVQTNIGGAFSNRTIPCDATNPDVCAPVSATLGLSVLATGKGTAGSADAGVLTIQGIASMTPIIVNNATAANLNATVVGSGVAGTANAGVLTVQGIAGMTPVAVSVQAGSAVTASQATAANLKTQASGAGTAGTADTGVQTVQGISGMVPLVVSNGSAGNLLATVSGSITATQGTGSNLHMVCDAGCSSTGAPADQGAFTFGTSSQTPVGAVFQTTATSNPLTNGQMGALQATINRALMVNLRNATGAEVGVAAVPLQVSLVNTGSNATPVTVGQATAANLNARVTGTGTAGTADTGVQTIQGIASMTPVQVSQATAANLNATVAQATAASLNATVVGSGAAGSPASGVVSVQGIGSGTAITVAQTTGSSLHVACDSGCSSSTAPADEAAFTFGTTSQTPIGGVFQTTATSNALTTGQMGVFQVTANRALFSNLRNAAGTEVGTSITPLQVSLANTAANGTAVLVTAAQATAANLNATVVQSTAANLNANVSQATAANLKTQATGAGTAGTPDAGVQTIQGIASMTPVQISQSTAANLNATVSQATGTNLHIVCDSGCTTTTAADKSTFTASTSPQTLIGGFFQTTATSNALTTGQQGAFQVTAQRALFANLRDASGTELGTSTTPLQVSLANTGANGTALVVSQSTAANLNATVVQSTAANLKTTANLFGNGGAVLDFAGQNAASPANAMLTGCQFNTTPTALTSGRSTPVQCDSGGNTLVNLATALPPGSNTIGAVTQASGPWTVQGSAGMTPVQTTVAPTSASAAGITSVVSAAAENNHVLKASAGNLYSVYATNLTSTAGFLVVLNSTTSPADGAITPLACVPLPASSYAQIDYSPGPPQVFSTGITAVVSSATTCFTKTTGTITAFINGRTG
jgi:hypothetical protein